MGVFKKVELPVFEDAVTEQMDKVKEKKGAGKMSDLIMSGETWEVK